MEKIIVFGNSGAGKTTLAKKLQQDFSLAHLDLDTLAWSSSSIPVRKPLKESIKEIDDFLLHATGWVVEGCYADLLAYAAQYATEVIFLNPGIEACIKNSKIRPWEPHKYQSKEAQDNNLEMLINWIEQYERREDEFSLKAHKALYDSFMGIKSEIK